MSVDRGLDEDVVHTHNGMLRSHKKEQNWIVCNAWIDLDCHTEGGESEREKQYCLLHVYVDYRKNNVDDLICKTGIQTQTYRTNL